MPSCAYRQGIHLAKNISIQSLTSRIFIYASTHALLHSYTSHAYTDKNRYRQEYTHLPTHKAAIYAHTHRVMNI